MTTYTGTYSPEDNKLRLYASSRLDSELYARVRALGFIFAPKQDLFVAPKWTPSRADLLLELCGEIGDEDTSLVDRAEMRADRFEGYCGNRTKDAELAHKAVSSIAENIPFGQPILVGHHSERRARKDAERIENGMRKAVQMWDTAEYWKRRAAGALSHAKYKELPAVRARRIKGIEADKRRQENSKSKYEAALILWKLKDITHEFAMDIANRWNDFSMCFTLAKYPRELPVSQYEGMMSIWSALNDGIITAEQAAGIAIPAYERRISSLNRWIQHNENRLAYERAMLQEQIGTTSENFDIQIGGKVKIAADWYAVTRVNRKDGVINSVSVAARYSRIYSIVEVLDYVAPTSDEVATMKEKTKLPPLCNFPGEGFIEMTAEQWKRQHPDYRITRIQSATDDTGAYRYRKALTAGCRTLQVYITDAKRVDPPKKKPDTPTPAEIVLPVSDATPSRQLKASEQNDFDAMRSQLKQGVQVVVAPQLFPTPPSLAARMVALADLQEGQNMLEPSAGTGNILQAVRDAVGGSVVRTAVEINSNLCDRLRIREAGAEILQRNFLECSVEDLGQFDAVIMNPPFVNAQDITHIQHAMTMLKPAGRLVAICANGPRQNDALRPLVERRGGTWEELPSDAFAQSGTQVRTVLLTIGA